MVKNFMIGAIYLICNIMFWTQCAGNNRLYSQLLVLLIMFIPGFYAMHFVELTIKAKELALLLCVVFVGFLAYYLISTDIDLNFDALKRYILFMEALIFLLCVFRLSINRIVVNILYGSLSMVVVYAILTSQASSNYDMDALIYGFPNPNSAGMFFYLVTTYLVMGTLIYRQKYIKIALWILTAGAIHIIYLTKSRTSLICALLIILIVLFRYLPKLWTRRFILGAFVLSPFVTSYFYIVLWNIIDNKSVRLLGKPLFSERQRIWIRAYDYLSSHPFAVHYNQNANVANSGTFAHNLYVSIWWEYGVIILLAVIVIFLFVLFDFNKRVGSFADFALLCSIGCIFVQQSFEDSLFSSVWVYVMAFSLLSFVGYLDKLKSPGADTSLQKRISNE